MPRHLPVFRFLEVYHVGTLDIAARQEPAHRNSYEGELLSVSRHPNAWARIARLGSTVWTLRADALYLSAMDLTKEDRAEAVAWAIKSGLVEMASGYRLSWFDEEMEERLSSDFRTLAAAEAEKEGLDGMRPRLKPVTVPVLTALGSQRHVVRAATSDLSDATDLAVVSWAADVLTRQVPSLAGVWWQERLDPAALSAPRGGIFPECLDRFVRLRRAPPGDDAAKPVKRMVEVDMVPPSSPAVKPTRRPGRRG